MLEDTTDRNDVEVGKTRVEDRNPGFQFRSQESGFIGRARDVDINPRESG